MEREPETVSCDTADSWQSQHSTLQTRGEPTAQVNVLIFAVQIQSPALASAFPELPTADFFGFGFVFLLVTQTVIWGLGA